MGNQCCSAEPANNSEVVFDKEPLGQGELIKCQTSQAKLQDLTEPNSAKIEADLGNNPSKSSLNAEVNSV